MPSPPGARPFIMIDSEYEVLLIVGNTREGVILDVRQRHLESVILEEANRRVSHDCSNSTYLHHPVPPSFVASSRPAAHKYTKLPPGFRQVFCSIREQLCQLPKTYRRAFPPELWVDETIDLEQEFVH